MTEMQVYEPGVEASVVLRGQTDSWVDVVADVARLASQIADTEFVPDSMRRRPAAVTACILSGRELNVAPMTSLAHIHIVKGKPGMSAQLMRALILSAGHDLDFREATTTRCVVAGRRRGSENWTTAAFTSDDAKRARIDLGGYPEDKLVARATARLARRIFADVLGGMPYLAEELEDLDGPDLPTVTSITDAPKRRTAKRSTAKPATAPVERVDAPVAPEPQYDEPPFDDDSVAGAGEADDSTTPPGAEQSEVPATGPSEAQNRLMHRMFADLGITDRTERLEFTSEIVGRVLTTSTELTRGDASRLIDHMARELGEVAPDEDAS